MPTSERLRELRDEFGLLARRESWIIYSFQEQYGVEALGNKKVGHLPCCVGSCGTPISLAYGHFWQARYLRHRSIP